MPSSLGDEKLISRNFKKDLESNGESNMQSKADRGKENRRPKKTWKMQVEKESKSVGLEKKDAMNQARWRMGVREIAAGVNPGTAAFTGINPDQNCFDNDDETFTCMQNFHDLANSNLQQ